MRKLRFLSAVLLLAAASQAFGQQEFRVSAWTGYNTWMQQNLVQSVLGAFSNVQFGGTSMGVDLWAGSRFQYGIGFAYLPVFSSNYEDTYTVVIIPVHVKVSASADSIPLVVHARYFLTPRLYVGVGLGINAYRVDTSSTLEWFVPFVGASGVFYAPIMELTAGLTILQDSHGKLVAGVRAYTEFPSVLNLEYVMPMLVLSYAL
ncbi:MAG TPA: hypothetical protein VMV68_10100 [Spirochaetia bacterium]|nr:hypothetical protein [Spirochaetia bacterium]